MEKETKIKIVNGTAFVSKAVIGSVSAACASYVLKNVLEDLMPAPVTLPAKIATKVGIAVIGGAAAAMANTTVNEMIDATVGAATLCLDIEEVANADCTADGTNVEEYECIINELVENAVDVDDILKEDDEDAGSVRSCIA